MSKEFLLTCCGSEKDKVRFLSWYDDADADAGAGGGGIGAASGAAAGVAAGVAAVATDDLLVLAATILGCQSAALVWQALQ